MSNTSHEHMIVQGGNLAVVLPATLVSGEVSALGTAIKHEALVSTEITLPAEETSNEVISQEMDNGVTVEMPKVTTIMSAVTGAEKTASGATSGYKIKFDTLEADRASIIEAAALLDGDTAFACVSLGELTDGSSDGYAFIYGVVSASLTRSTKGNQFASLSLEISGVEGVAASGFDHADLNTGFGITGDPMGGTAITKIIDTGNAFVAGDVTDLLAGKIVFKDAV